METAIVSLICIALIVFGGMTMSQGFMTSVDSTSAGLEEISNRGEEIMRTELTTGNATVQASTQLQVNLENGGQTKLASFDKWDVIVQYYDETQSYQVVWLPYTEGTPGNNEWTVAGIYLNGQPEAFEPNIFNPKEELQIQANLNPPVGDNTTNLVVISTPNGVPASIPFEN